MRVRPFSPPGSFPLTGLALFVALTLLALPAGAQLDPVMEDDFESGDPLTQWSSYTDSGIPACDCYFSGDCPAGMFCDWGTLTQEDTCFWVEVKPNGTVGAGCDEPHIGGWTAGICDGICAPTNLGSLLGGEPADLVSKAVQLWAESMLVPAADGGGEPLEDLAEAALALEFSGDDVSMLIGRETANLLFQTTDLGFYDHFCHYEAGKPVTPDLYVDLSGDSCRQQIGWLTAEALAAEILRPGAAGAILAQIAGHCSDWQQRFAPRCEGESALACLTGEIEDKAHYLSTYRGPAPDPSV